MQTGENEQGLRKVLELTRAISLVLLILHIYFYFGQAFDHWHLHTQIMVRLLQFLFNAGLFHSFHESKLLALGFLFLSLLGARGKKSVDLKYQTGFIYLLVGLTLYFGSYFAVYGALPIDWLAVIYSSVTGLGYILVLTGGTLLSRVIQGKIRNYDIFNRENESFPQEERLLENEYSINLRAQYRLKGKTRSSWINIINPFRGLLVVGSPGAGKSYFVIQEVIRQHIEKGFAIFVYDFKFDDLTLIAYAHWLQHKDRYPVAPAFYSINFDDLRYSHRCNPLNPADMQDITDAAESARAMLFSINRNWITRQGDFFVESPINFLTAIIWFLRKYQDGAFCSLPHTIELMQVHYDKLFTVLRAETELEVLINPFVTAFENDVMDQLEGQVGGTKIAMAKLSSPSLYYVLTGQDFTLDLNNPAAPKIICMGNNPQKQLVYNAVLSLYISRLIKLANKKGRMKTSLIFDEFPTIYLNGVDTLIATARSNQVATTLVVQDLSQLRKDYGREQADVIMNLAGNLISGQVTGDTARQLSDRFGKIMQPRTSLSINSSEASTNQSMQLDPAIPASKIASLSSGEFVGMVADNPDFPIELKAFHCQIAKKENCPQIEPDPNIGLPLVRNVSEDQIRRNYLQIKQDIQDIINAEMERILCDPSLDGSRIRKD